MHPLHAACWDQLVCRRSLYHVHASGVKHCACCKNHPPNPILNNSATPLSCNKVTGEEWIAFEIECAIEHCFNSHLCRHSGCTCMVPTPAMSAEGNLVAAHLWAEQQMLLALWAELWLEAWKWKRQQEEVEALLWWEIVEQFSTRAGLAAGGSYVCGIALNAFICSQVERMSGRMMKFPSVES